MARSVRSRYRLDSDFVIDDLDPAAGKGGPKSKAKARERTAEIGAAVAELQEKLFAEAAVGGHRSVLLVLQGMDTSGKGGVIDHVVGLVGPSGCRVHAFKKPTPEELEHDFLWRIRNALPRPGVLGVFDRSHYEDVLITRVHGDIDDAERDRRLQQINDFEAELIAGGTTVIKCFLQVSYEKQRERLLARLDDPTKHWKFNEADIDERRLWPDYQRAYEYALRATSSETAPWYAIPADRKPHRNWAVAEILLETLTDLDPHYPQVDLDLKRLKGRLDD